MGDTPLEDLVMGVEKYRRDRGRRILAGDESARLSFPKPVARAKGGKSGPPLGIVTKRSLQPEVEVESSAKRPCPEPKSPTTPPAAKPVQVKARLAKAPVAREPAVKARVPKTPGDKAP